MLRTALRNVLAHKARLMMTVLAVLLGVSFVSGTLVFTDTVGDAFKNSSKKSFAHTSVVVRSDEAAPFDDGGGPDEAPAEHAWLDQGLLEEVAALPGTARATGTVSGSAFIADKDGDLLGDGWSNLGGNYSGKRDVRYPLTAGRAPAAADEVVLDKKTADRAGFEVGDTVRLSVDGPVLEQKLVGVFTTDDGNVAAGGTLALFDTRTAQKLFTAPGQYDEILLKAAPGTSEEKLKAEVAPLLPKGTEAETGTALADEQADFIADQTKNLSTVLLGFAGIALFVGVFIIANTFTMIVAQRTRELALLRAVGATRRQVTRSVLAESFVVGAVASALGFALGLLVAVGMEAAMGAVGGTVPESSLVIAPRTVVVAMLVGVAVTMLAAWLPARRAAKIPPVAAMGSADAAPTARGLLVRNTIGAAVTALGLAVLAVGVSGKTYPVLGLGAGVTLTGVIVLTPLLSRPAIALAGPVLRWFGVSGKLARQNAVRNPRRTAATAAALMIGLTLISGLTVIANSMRDGIDKMAGDSLKADYTISMAGYRPLSPDVARTLERDPQVTAVSPLRRADVEVDGRAETATGVNPAAIGDLLRLDFTSGSLKGLEGDGVIVDDDLARDRGWKVGDTLPVTYDSDGAKASYTVAGVYRGNDMIYGIMAPTTAVDPHLRDVLDSQVMINTRGGESDRAEEAVQRALGDNPAVKVQTVREVSDEYGSMITQMLTMLYGLLAMAVIIAVVGVVNTLAMSVFERSREIGMLRAVGLDRGGIKRMVRLESVVISLFGAGLGIGLGVFFAWTLSRLIRPEFSTYSMTLPWGTLAGFAALAAVVGVLAALWPARRAARLNVLAAIKSD
ncbi:ABC transporter permease [Streptomyces capparidis]